MNLEMPIIGAWAEFEDDALWAEYEAGQDSEDILDVIVDDYENFGPVFGLDGQPTAFTQAMLTGIRIA